MLLLNALFVFLWFVVCCLWFVVYFLGFDIWGLGFRDRGFAIGMSSRNSVYQQQKKRLSAAETAFIASVHSNHVKEGGL